MTAAINAISRAVELDIQETIHDRRRARPDRFVEAVLDQQLQLSLKRAFLVLFLQRAESSRPICSLNAGPLIALDPSATRPRYTLPRESVVQIA